MASIVGKRRGARTYYYLVESARVGGKPRIVSQQYLGSAEEVLAKLSEVPVGQPIRSRHKRFGDLAAVWSTLVRLDVAGIIDRVVPRRADAAASVGTYIALACANRIVDPCSKREFADWWAGTAGPRWVKLGRGALDHRRFWDAMDLLGEAQLREIETRIGRAMVSEFGLDLTGLALDMTNFATFIDTGNERAPIAQRGKAKQKRSDLRLVGLALVITRDGGVPVIAHAYPGDRPDVTQFPAVVDELVARYADLVSGVESLTVVYDAGQNSGDNHAVVEEHGIGFVGSLPPSDHPDLLAIPERAYRPVDPDRYPGLRSVDTTVTALGVTRRAVLTHSVNLAAKQIPRPGPGPGQGAAPTGRPAGPPGPRPHPPRAGQGRGRDRRDLHPPLGCRHHHRHPHRRRAGPAAADLAQRPARPRPPRKAAVRQAHPVYQPRLAGTRRGRRLPQPIRRRIRVPPTQRPARGLV